MYQIQNKTLYGFKQYITLNLLEYKTRTRRGYVFGMWYFNSLCSLHNFIFIKMLQAITNSPSGSR